MASILLIMNYSCESNLGDKDDLQDTQIFEKNETPTRIPTLVPVIDDIPSTVEPLSLETPTTSTLVCPCDVKSALTSSTSMDVYEKSEEINIEPSINSTATPIPTATPMPIVTATLTPVAKELVLQIEIKNYKFQEIIINLGEVVEWKNLDLDVHSTTSGSWGNDDVGNLWDSGKLTFGKKFKFKFTESGEYPYFCRIHPAMKGLVSVVDLSK